MKSKLTLIILIAISGTLYAQAEWAPIGAKWYFNKEHSTILSGEESYQVKIVESIKDTIVQNKTCRLIDNEITFEDHGKIFYLFKDTFRLIYDFTLNVGDTAYFEMINCRNAISVLSFKVDSINSVLFNTISLKRFVLRQIPEIPEDGITIPESDYIYYEKFGSISRLIENRACEAYNPEWIFEWLRCYEDSDIDFHSDRFNQSEISDKECDFDDLSNATTNKLASHSIQLYPNPTQDYITIEYPKPTQDQLSLEVLGMAGRVMTRIDLSKTKSRVDLSKLSPGLYVFLIKSEAMIIERQLVLLN